jgi:hypothetical protein
VTVLPTFGGCGARPTPTWVERRCSYAAWWLYVGVSASIHVTCRCLRSTTDVRFVEADSAGWDTSSLKFDALQSYADLRVDRRQYCDAISEVLLCIFAQVSVNVMPFGK